jgi:gamma-glutamylputrescine oxidase
MPVSATHYPDSYYYHSANQIKDRPYLQENINTEVCIIGAGYTGLLSAINLAEKGYKVVVLESNRVGWGASGRNGGQVGSGHNKKIQLLEKDYGKSLARDLWNLSEEAKNIVEERIKFHEISCDLKQGNATVSNDPNDDQVHRDYVEKLNSDYDYKSIRYMDSSEVSEMFHSPFFNGGGSLDMGGMHLHPLNYALGLADAAEKLGVTIYEQSKVISYTKSEPSLIKTNKGNVTAKIVVLACNAYLEKLERKLAVKIMPVNNFMLATEPLSKEDARYINKDDVCAHDNKFHVHYFRMSEDNRLLFGGGENYTRNYPKDLKSYVRKTMLDVFPHLSNTAIDYAWGGTIGVTVNRMSHIGRLEKNIYSFIYVI